MKIAQQICTHKVISCLKYSLLCRIHFSIDLHAVVFVSPISLTSFPFFSTTCLSYFFLAVFVVVGTGCTQQKLWHPLHLIVKRACYHKDYILSFFLYVCLCLRTCICISYIFCPMYVKSLTRPPRAATNLFVKLSYGLAVHVYITVSYWIIYWIWKE